MLIEQNAEIAYIQGVRNERLRMWMRDRLPRNGRAALVLRTLLLGTLLLVGGCGAEGEGGTESASEPAERTSAPEALPEGAEAVSLLGEPLVPPELDPEFQASQEAKLDAARRALEANPEGADERIWVGRRLAYLGQYREAIETYTRAIELHPDDPRLYRHRGHRYITTRRLDRATTDLSRAAELIEGTEDEVEPDGLPNERGIPTSTLHFNVWYHLGLAHYLAGRYEEAAEAYEACLEASRHVDTVVATTYWYYLTLRRLGRDDEAEALLEAVPEDPDVIESEPYLDLLRLFRGEVLAGQLLGPMGDEASVESVTTAYGVGARHLLEGRADEAYLVFRTIVRSRDQWSAFGYIAAEAELARIEVGQNTNPGGSGGTGRRARRTEERPS